MDGSGLEAALEKNNKVEMLNIVQVESGQAVEINPDRDKLLTEFGKSTLLDRYLMPGETPQNLFARVASSGSLFKNWCIPLYISQPHSIAAVISLRYASLILPP